MIDEKLADRNTVGPSMQEKMLETLQQIEKHLKAMVYYTTPERAFTPSAGKATMPTGASEIEEMVSREIEKYLKENK
tara:strand:+ start:196 stop:426 length:231 start_codon:yes stop_codon:yes gene_type:complete